MARAKVEGLDPMARVIGDIEMPLRNAEYAINSFLLANGTRLDVETRRLLAGVRDCLHDVSDETRRLTRPSAR